MTLERMSKSMLNFVPVLLGVLSLAVACGDDASPDASTSDATSTDATSTDAPSTDSEAADVVADASVGAPVFDYVPVDGARCANGTPVGMGVSAAEGASTLLVFVNGGGACWDGPTCFGASTAVHISTTYDETVLAADIAPLLGSALIRRGGDSPIAGASFAFIPYCTGDLHSGNAVRDVPSDLIGGTREVHHVGRVNMEAFSRELAARFDSVDKVVLIGFSAGGFGAVINADVFDADFGQSVDVLADGSPFIQPTEYATWRAQWDMTLPEGCAECDSTFGALLAHQTEGRRHGLITTTNDEVIRVFFGYAIGDITAQTLTLIETHYDVGERHAWAVTGTDHVLLGGYATRTRATGASLREWTDAFLTGGEAFTTLVP